VKHGTMMRESADTDDAYRVPGGVVKGDWSRTHQVAGVDEAPCQNDAQEVENGQLHGETGCSIEKLKL
jgi:hypothetical protein